MEQNEREYIVNWAKAAFICGQKGGTFEDFLSATQFPIDEEQAATKQNTQNQFLVGREVEDLFKEHLQLPVYGSAIEIRKIDYHAGYNAAVHLHNLIKLPHISTSGKYKETINMLLSEYKKTHPQVVGIGLEGQLLTAYYPQQSPVFKEKETIREIAKREFDKMQMDEKKEVYALYMWNMAYDSAAKNLSILCSTGWANDEDMQRAYNSGKNNMTDMKTGKPFVSSQEFIDEYKRLHPVDNRVEQMREWLEFAPKEAKPYQLMLEKFNELFPPKK